MKKIAKYAISLKIFIKNDKGEVLILQNGSNSTFANKYDFPGGRIDDDELLVSLEDILKREIKEETGNLDVEIGKEIVAQSRYLISKEFTSSGNDELIYNNFWEGKLLSGKVEISDEHISYKWVNLQEIRLEDYFSSGMLEGVKMYLNK